MSAASLTRGTLLHNGVALSWYDAGGPGLPVLFQHGLCGDVHQTAEAFPRDGAFRLITLECRGHGQSMPGDQGRFSIQTFADDAAALIEQLALGPVVVGGISMGAAIATRLAARRPELVRGLALVRPAWVASAAPANMAPNGEVGALLARMAPACAEATFIQGETYRRLARDAPDNLASLMGFFRREPIAVTSALLTSIAADGPGITEPDLRALSVPALVVGTERDAIHPLALAKQLAALMPRARFANITPKATDKAGYLADLHLALGAFLKEF